MIATQSPRSRAIPRATVLPANRVEKGVEANTVRTWLIGNRRDLYAALRMVYLAYRETELIEANCYEMRAIRHHVLATTQVFLAEQNGELSGTITLVRDGKLGLPMEDVYDMEIADRRNRGAVIAEVSCLTNRAQGKGSSLSVLVQLMRHVAQFSRYQGVDELLAAVHPHHVGFYERFIGFEQIGEERGYSAVRNQPAVALKLDLNTLSQRHPRAYERLFDNPFSDEELTAKPFDIYTVDDLQAIVEATQPKNIRVDQLLVA